MIYFFVDDIVQGLSISTVYLAYMEIPDKEKEKLFPNLEWVDVFLIL